MSNYAIIPDGGHNMHMDNPQAVVNFIINEVQICEDKDGTY